MDIHNETLTLTVSIPLDVVKRWPGEPTDEDVMIVTKAVDEAILNSFYGYMMKFAEEARDE